MPPVAFVMYSYLEDFEVHIKIEIYSEVPNTVTWTTGISTSISLLVALTTIKEVIETSTVQGLSLFDI